MPKKILVVGSSNVDLILKILRFPDPGETLKAQSLITAFGGKGANQAMAAKRLGGDVVFVTKLGHDQDGKSYLQYLTRAGFDPKWISRDRKARTGLALVELIPEGENRIIISSGANALLRASDIGKLGLPWKEIGIFVTQLEIPTETIARGLKKAKRSGAITLLNPAPPARLATDILESVDFLLPNETEAQFLSGRKIKTERDIPRVAQELLEMGVGNVVITLGSKGLFFKNSREEIRMDAFKVNVLDTTAAGDAFVGGFACGLAEEMPVRKLLTFASAAGALAATKVGAQPSLPSRRSLARFLHRCKGASE